MKMTSTLLFDFIGDFNLESSEPGVCFDAMVDFNITGQTFNFQSEVLIESFLLTHPDTIYLLNRITQIYKIPNFFNGVNHHFIYFKNRVLFIAGYTTLFGSYSISIFPVSGSCTQKTFDELRAKKLN
jgi:hypothetical protein